ncbi:unnamed protein product [Cuscuta campestris]|uniref:Uncharacterized protein n=1 Tax=Cuscuta campestris TaxID=132261 RepID=A0A484NFV1_9ASTE|nr:unnamed protein product [Cuscuta campestris]
MYRRPPIRLYQSILKRSFRKFANPRSTFPPEQPLISGPNTLLEPPGRSLLRRLHPASAKVLPDLRLYSADADRVVDEINLKFAEAREEIESAMESKETLYFDEEAECARKAVNEVLELYEGLLQKLPEKEREAIQRSMGLKIEQLKAELEQLNE